MSNALAEDLAAWEADALVTAITHTLSSASPPMAPLTMKALEESLPGTQFEIFLAWLREGGEERQDEFRHVEGDTIDLMEAVTEWQQQQRSRPFHSLPITLPPSSSDMTVAAGNFQACRRAQIGGAQTERHGASPEPK
jgi:hypothetical protein